MAMTKFLADSVTQSAFSLRLWRSMFLVKFQTFTMNGNDRLCFFVSLQVVPMNMKALLKTTVTDSVPELVFGKVLGLY